MENYRVAGAFTVELRACLAPLVTISRRRGVDSGTDDWLLGSTASSPLASLSPPAMTH